MKKKLKDVISKEFKGLWGTDFSYDGIPVIKTNNMTYEGRIDFSDICIRNIPYDEAENNFLKKGDLIIEKSGGTKTHSVGYVNIFEGEDDKYVCNNFILPLRPNTELVFPKYLFWQLHGMYEAGCFSDCYNKTTGIQNLQKKTYFSKDINLPSKEEQIKIAAHLDTIQSAIDNKKQQLALLDEAVKSEFVEMFGENPVENGKWKVETLGDVCSSIVRGPFGSALKKDFFVPKSNDTVKVYEQKHAIQKSAEIGTYYITNEKYEELKRFECKSGDFLMSCSGTMGEFYQLPEGCEKGIINQALCKFTLNNKLNSIMFLEWMKHSISNLETKGSGIKNVAAVSFVKQMPMFIPPKNLQEKYAAFVQQIDKSKFVVKQQISDLQEFLDSKMQEYFGE